MKLGTFSVPARISKIGSPDRYRDVSLQADTGATFTAVPSSLLRELDAKVERPLRFRLADGSLVERGAGHVRIDLGEGHSLPFTPVVFGDEGVFLLGAVTLETMLLAVDPVRRRLVAVEGLLLADLAA